MKARKLLILMPFLFLQCTLGEDNTDFLDISLFLGHKNDKVIKESFPTDSINQSMDYIEEGTLEVKVTNVRLDGLNYLTFIWDADANEGTSFIQRATAYQFPTNLSNLQSSSKKIGVIIPSFPEKGKTVRIYLGMTIEELENILGEFEFAGLEWDCSGMVTTKLPKQFGKIHIGLGIPPVAEVKMESIFKSKAYKELLGDGTFRSSNKNAREIGLQIVTLSVFKK